MGYQFEWDGDQDPRGGASRNTSKPNSNNGLLQHCVVEGVEVHLSTDKGKCKGGLAATDQSSLGRGEEPMVELSDGQTLTEGGAYTGLGAPPTDIISPHFVQCQPRKVSFEEKDIGE